MYIKTALTEWLRERGHAVITDYDLARAIIDFYRIKSFNGEAISVRKDIPDDRDVRRAIRDLIEDKILTRDSDIDGIAYRVFIVSDETAEDILCSSDPFIYVSHLSAMQRHGLTDRNPVKLSLSRPAASLWKRVAAEKAAADFGELASRLAIAPPRRPLFPDRVRKRAIQIHDTRYPGVWQQVRNTAVRVSSIGQTFADMLTRPEWCGGMAHVLSVWDNHAETFLEEVIEAIDHAPVKLVKVRAGYILDERLNLRDNRIEVWTALAQRGSSQRLDPTVEYKPSYSEKWMISLNADEEQNN